MDSKADHCWKRAACYERIAGDESAPKEIRMRFVHQANLLRIKARLAELDDKNASVTNNHAHAA